jgi:hypothetical protein
METNEAYFARKESELELMASCLREPITIKRPASIGNVIKEKFHLAAALKAEHALQDWAHTETDWAHQGSRQVGSFTFSYDYQRADLEVKGPSFYGLQISDQNETIYAASGMAAISALLLASAHVTGEADIITLPGTYGETIEVIEGYARHCRLIKTKVPFREIAARPGRSRILLFDSCVSGETLEKVLNIRPSKCELVLFDTTCFACGSTRIRRVVDWAKRWQLPLVLLRSHNKLDSLGAEYGRLGSAVFINGNKQLILARLADETRNAIRLLGSAALPAHFPPYVGHEAHWHLTHSRIASILRNSRRMTRGLASVPPSSPGIVRYAHGLYVTLNTAQHLDEAGARERAAELSHDLSKEGLPLRHAGSFGFDFAATEWFHDFEADRYLVRIAVGDLPTTLSDELTNAIATWWSARERKTLRASQINTPARRGHRS